MTRDKAIEEVKSYENYPNGLSQECRDYIIKALEQEPTTKNNLGVDCIVDVLGSYTDLDIPYKREIAENILTKLSSVTPQEPKIFPIAEIKYDKDKLKELVNNAVLTVTPQEPNIKVLEQEPILDKIYADIQRLRGCSCSCSDGIIDDIEDILDKYKAESEK